MATLFTRIIQGELPSYKIYEDDYTFAFLSLDQVKSGHTLVVPKTEIDHWIDVPEPYYSSVFKSAQLIARALQKATGCSRVSTIIAGWDVPHFHYHLIPTNKAGEADFSLAKVLSQEEMKALQSRIVSELESL